MPTREPSSTPTRTARSGLTADDVMTADPRTCSPFSTASEAALIFRDEDCGAIPVVEGGRPIGILTDRDIALATAEFPDLTGRPFADVMTRGVISVAPDIPLSEVEAKFGDAENFENSGKVRRIRGCSYPGPALGPIARPSP
jgi:CBS domain-containing protein